MENATTFNLDVSTEEWELLIQLLSRERSSLPVEIHHTRSSEFREILRRRLVVLDELLNKFEAHHRVAE